MERTGMMLSRKLIVGICPTTHLFEDNNPYHDRYEFVNNYVKKVYDSDAIPVGLVLNNGNVDESELSICDCFIYPGGTIINHHLYQVLKHAYQTKKPVLGICMGMQAMCVFSVMQEECEKVHKDYFNCTDDEINTIYQDMKKKRPTLTGIAEPSIHNYQDINRDNIPAAMHKVSLMKGSFLNETYGTDDIMAVSLHHNTAIRTGKFLEETAFSKDGILEGVESKIPGLFWIGVQFHPEIVIGDSLIPAFIDECKKIKEKNARNS